MNESEYDDPQYWWGQADRFIADARDSLKSAQSKESVLDRSHGAIERQLKAILVERTGKVRLIHDLSELMQSASLEEELPEQIQVFLKAAAKLHGIASYPTAEAIAEWVSAEGFQSFLCNTRKTWRYLNKYR